MRKIKVATHPQRLIILLEKVNNKICENCQFTISELSMCFPQISLTLLYETVAESLYYKEVCARWVPEMLMD
jgi:hypothetical protein